MSDVVLHGEDVADVAVVRLGPELVTVGDARQLRRQSHPFAGSPNAPFQNCGRAERPPELPDVLDPPFEREYGSSGSHPQAGDARQRADQLFGHPVAEVFVIGIGAPVDERQHGE